MVVISFSASFVNPHDSLTSNLAKSTLAVLITNTHNMKASTSADALVEGSTGF